MFLVLEKNKPSIIIVMLIVSIHIYILYITGSSVIAINNIKKIPETAKSLVAKSNISLSGCSENSTNWNGSDHPRVVSNSITCILVPQRGTDFV